MSLLLPDSGLLFWMLLSFGVVFVVLAKYGFPVITKMVEGRRTYIDQSLEVARQANIQLAKLKEESEALIAAANKEQGASCGKQCTSVTRLSSRHVTCGSRCTERTG